MTVQREFSADSRGAAEKLQMDEFLEYAADFTNDTTKNEKRQSFEDNMRSKRDSIPLRNGCEDTWSWNRRDRSQEAQLGVGNKTVQFHPNWSKGTAGVRGTRVLNNGRYYWELKLSDRIFGTR